MQLRRLAIRPLALLVCLGAAATATPTLAQDGHRLAAEAAKAHVQGKLDVALAQFTEALRDTKLPNDRRAIILNDRGALLARLNRPEAALQEFNRAVQLYPEYAGVYNNRGSTLLTIGLPSEAIKDFDRAILLAPGYVAAFNNRANAFLLLKQYDQAIQDFTRAISLTPNAVAALSGRGRAHLAIDHPQAAMRDFSRVVDIDTRLALGYRNRAKANVLAEQYAAAVEDLSRAIAFNPADHAVYLERGEAYLAAQDVAAAIKDYSKALELSPTFAAALEARALAYVRIDAHAEAEADIQRVLQLSPRSGAAQAARALLYLRTGQPALALQEIARAQKLEPSRGEILSAKGEIEEATGKRDAAIASYRAALSTRPDLRQAAIALDRLGAGLGGARPSELAALGIADWQVTQRGRRYIANNPKLPGLNVPLEATGQGLPRLLAWDIKDEPFEKIALLRFGAGRLSGATPEDVENVAIIDLRGPHLLGIVPDRRGTKRAKWSWGEGKLVVASVDGLTDEFALKGGKSRAAEQPVAATRRRTNRDGYAPPGWIPWQGDQPSQSRRSASSSRRRQPKSLFDMIFGN